MLFSLPAASHAVVSMPIPESTLRALQEDPLLIQDLNLTDDEKNKILDQVIRISTEEEETPATPKAAPSPLAKPTAPPAPVYDFTKITVPVKPEDPEIIFDHASMANPEDWKVKYFDVVIVVNKAVGSEGGQTLHLYYKPAGRPPLLLLGPSKISTGRETVELKNADRLLVGMKEDDHAPKNSYFSNTPNGYFTPFRLTIDHVSGDYEDSAMDYAMFFNIRGIATHKAPPGTERRMGRRASGACVRMLREDSRNLFWIVRSTGGPITPGEMAGSKQKRITVPPSFAAELPYWKITGFKTLNAAPEIPVFSREGVVSMGRNGKPKMRKGLFRTLVVVEDNPFKKKKF